jgi:molybdopterin converting factor subunit 1
VRIRVLFFGPLADLFGTREEVLDIAEQTCLRDVYERYRARNDRLGEPGKNLLLAVNQDFCSAEVTLHDNDEVAFLPPMSGGSPDVEPTSPDVVEIIRAPIDATALRQRLQCPRDGAVVVFHGVVRNHSRFDGRERQTLFLKYEAYEPMAVRRMRELADEARRRWAISAVAIQHRLGRLEIGEASVVIVVTAAHRRAAFEACAWLIDSLKRTVPIWKKEHFSDGSEWVEGEMPEAGMTGTGAGLAQP